MTRRLQGRPPRDEGAALILALLFLTMFGVFIGFVLQFGSTTLRSGVNVRSEATTTYSADGAADGAVNAIRSTLSSGVDPGTTPIPATPCFTLPAGQLGNTTALTVSCQPRSGSGAAAAGSTVNQPAQAVLTTSGHASEGVSTTGTASVAHKGDVLGKTRLDVPAGTTLTSTTRVAATTCSVGGTVTPAQECAAAIPGDPGYDGPSAYPSIVSTLPACTTPVVRFSPGTYLSRTSLQALFDTCANTVFWFQPGTYYFDFRDAGSHQWVIDTASRNSVVVGGTASGWTPGTTAAAAVPFPTAASPTTSACSTTGTGVQFVFGADSGMDVRSGKVQLCATANATTQRIALYGYGSTNPPGALPGTGVATSTGATDLNTGTRPWVTPANGAAVDGATAYVKIPNTSSGNSTLELSAYSGVLPPEATGNVTVTAQIVQMLSGTGVGAVTFVPGNGAASTTVSVATCPPATPCNDVALRTYTAPAFTVPVVQLSGAKIRYEVSNPNNQPIEVWLDGVTLSLAFSAPMRATSGTATAQPYVSGSAGTTAVLKASGAYGTAVLAIRGTVYVPGGVVDLALTGLPHEVVDRGIIARHVRYGLTPAGGYTGPLVSIPPITQSPRVVLLTVADATATVLLRVEVRLADLAGTSNGTIPRVLSWSHQ